MFGLPVGAILFFMSGRPRFVPLYYYGDHKVVNGDTVSYYTQPPFTFVDHNGESITEKDFENQIIVVNYVYEDCPSSDACPIDFLSFKRYISTELADNPGFTDVKIISKFVPAKSCDTLKAMQEFISDNAIDTDIWKLVTGDMSQFYNISINGTNPWNTPDTNFGFPTNAHVMTLLIDKSRHIRGQYGSRFTSEVTRITKEISLLLREELDAKAN